jgi:hypothetical protein
MAEFDRYLVIDDSDDDVTQILTVICESSGSRRPRKCDATEQGGAP